MEIDERFSPSPSPSRVSLPLISRSISRLSSCYSEPNRPSCVARRKLSWITLQGRLVGVDGATSARAVGPGLNRDEAVAWELFSPLHRVLLVALVAAATAKSRASQKIRELKRSVDLRVCDWNPHISFLLCILHLFSINRQSLLLSICIRIW